MVKIHLRRSVRLSERQLQRHFALPDSDDSDNEADEGAVDELFQLSDCEDDMERVRRVHLNEICSDDETSMNDDCENKLDQVPCKKKDKKIIKNDASWVHDTEYFDKIDKTFDKTSNVIGSIGGRVEAVASVTTANRFKKIVENMHCNDNEKQLPKSHPNHDKLHKIKPIIELLNANSRKVYKPSDVVTVDESMIPFKGRYCLKQYMPNKPVKWGYKVWCLCDSYTGFVVAFFVYTGKEDSTKNISLGEKVVTKLVEEANIERGSLVVMDNFFSSCSLYENLMDRETFACGTVKGTSKGLPSFMRKNLKNDKIMARGEFQFAVKNRTAAVKWMDRKAVCFLSSVHSPRNISTVRRRQRNGQRIEVGCPEVVKVYNETMGGVDKFDQLRECYAVGRRSVKWWHRIYYYLVDLAIEMHGRFLLCRTICVPSKISALCTIIDDPDGLFSSRLFLYNYADVVGQVHSRDAYIHMPVGTILAIMNPLFKTNFDGGYGIRCDNPAQVVKLLPMKVKELLGDITWRKHIPAQYLLRNVSSDEDESQPVASTSQGHFSGSVAPVTRSTSALKIAAAAEATAAAETTATTETTTAYETTTTTEATAAAAAATLP
ncbi:PiggyBac transposable element-derived protein 4 [Pseudolycoriella hygida]|uniref:PiggyBac transposable element-derived protein 4 n=1 Tax=Pseudolycoriella hygida TaxID=35572 RepID=A0A9Q0NHG9_9DIPT|nr:PiggyBac transposable element-derived protein 4 [Pseudolycoriella hygida]